MNPTIQALLAAAGTMECNDILRLAGELISMAGLDDEGLEVLLASVHDPERDQIAEALAAAACE